MRLEPVQNGRHPIPIKRSLFPVTRPTGLQILKGRLIGSGLPESIVDDWLGRHLVVNLRKSDVVFSQGTPADVIYFVRGGLIDVVAGDHGNGRVIVDMATPGDLLGFINFCDRGQVTRHPFDAVARSRCEIGILTRERIELVLAELPPKLLVSIGEFINDWWSQKIQHWVTFAAMSARERLKLVLNRLAEKCGVDDTYGTLITMQLSHDDFALMIGNSRPMVTRLLRDLIGEGWLCRRHNRYVVSKDPGMSGQTVPSVGMVR